MASHEEQSTVRQEPPIAAKFAWPSLFTWLPMCAILAVGVAWASTVIAKHFAPLLVFPILVGLALGITLVGLARLMQVGNRFTVLLGTILACLVAVAGQHYVSYRGDLELIRNQAESFRQAQIRFPDLVEGTAPEPVDNLLDYLRRQAKEGRPLLGNYVARGPAAWASWTADGLLLLAFALLVAMPAVRQPYCAKCRSWFRTTRRGRIDPDSARHLGRILQLELPDQIKSISYRVVSCSAGCDPTGFEICWVGESGKTASARLWLNADHRNQVTQALDASRKSAPPPTNNEQQTTNN